MGTQILSLCKTKFVFMYRKMVFFIRVLWVSFFTSLFTLFRSICQHFCRLRGKFETEKMNLSYERIQRGDDKKIHGDRIKDEEKEESESFMRFRFPTYEEFIRNNDVHSDDKFLYVKSEEDNAGCRDDVIVKSADKVSSIEEIVENSVTIANDVEAVDSHITSSQTEDSRSKRDGFGNVTEESHDICSGIENTERNDINLPVAGVQEKKLEEMDVENAERGGISVPIEVVDEEKSEEIDVEVVKESSQVANYSRNNVVVMRSRTHFISDDDSLVSDSDSDSMVSSSKSSFRSSMIDSLSDGYLSDIDFERAFEIDSSIEFGWKEIKSTKEVLTEEDTELQNLSKEWGTDDFEDEDEDILVELNNIESEVQDEDGTFRTKSGINMESEIDSEQNAGMSSSDELLSSDSEEQNLQSNLVGINGSLDAESGMHMEKKAEGKKNADNPSIEKLLSSVSEEPNLECNLAAVGDPLHAKSGLNMETEEESQQNAEKTSSGEQSSDSDEQNGLEREWEHQDLVEQLKMEIKKVRAIGLPTILEESESPKIMDDLKPWKIEEKYQYGGTMDELHKFYKSYRERMRKLDILNYQKMYAIGFLRLKDPLQSFTKNKISIPALATVVSIDCWPCKPKSSSEIHQPVMKKFTRELESDLEKVYVGQMCLSWEFLRWEYGKALELWDSDQHGLRQYNEVADKLQTFQVLLTRFLEDEPFQGPRVQHYVKSRCTLRNLLHVPVIRDDNSRDRKKEKTMVSTNDAITCVQLLEIIEESIRVLWQFIRSDKETSNAVLVTCRRSTNVELQNSTDASVLAEVRSTLQKKDKKLKELSRSENCVLRNFKKHQEEDSDHVLYFFSRVDLKLVSRVLNMSRITTEQLVWCKDKLSQINFVGKQLRVEPSVLLFPCS